MTTWRMRIACSIAKATNTHSECVTVVAFFTTTMVTRMRLVVKLHANGLSCLFHDSHNYMTQLQKDVTEIRIQSLSHYMPSRHRG